MDDFFGTPVSRQLQIHTDVAQVCKKGHLINSASQRSPEKNKKHCPDDGEETITKCPSCDHNIAGRITYPNVFGADGYKVPAYCIECGKAYPWTEENIRIAQELAKELEEVSQADIQVLETSIVDISKNDSQAQLGATRINRIMSKVASTTGDILKNVITDIASETAKKVLLGR